MFGQSLAETLARERGTIYKNPDGKAVRIALVYPNTYYLGMSNLGFQTIYRHLNERDDVVCERAFLPEPSGLEALSRSRKPLVTLESGLHIVESNHGSTCPGPLLPQDIAAPAAEQDSLPKAEAERAVNAVLEAIRGAPRASR